MAKQIVLEARLKGAQKTKRGLKGIDSGLRSLGKSAIAAGAAFFGGRAIIAGLQKSIELSAKMEGLQRGFDNLAKSAGFSAQTFSKLQKATDGTVSSFDLMKQANNAMLLGIADSEEQMAEMFDVAQRLASALGQDAAFGVESLVTGLGRQSKLMLDNLGIMVDTNKAYSVYASKLGITVNQLTDQQRKQAFVNAAMKEGKALVESLGEEQLTTADSINQMKNAVDDLAIKMGKKLAPFVNLFADSIKNATVLLSKFMGDEEETTITIDDQIETIKKQIEAYKAMGDETKAMDANLIFFIPKLSEQEILMNKGADAVNNFTQNLKDQIPELENHLQMLEQMKEGYEELDINIINTNMIWGELNQAIEQTGKWGDEIIIPLGDKLHVLALMSQQAFGMIASNLATISQAPGWEKMEKVAKRAAQVQALVDAYASANAAFKAMAGIPVVGPTLGYIAAATALAAGLANVKMIESAATGFDGIVNKPTMFMTGEAGAERVSVTPLEGPNINGPQGGNIHLHFGAVTNEDYVKDFIVPEIQKAQRLNLA